MEILRDWLSRANRTYRNEIVKELTEPSEQEAPKATAEEPARAAPSAPPRQRPPRRSPWKPREPA
jgi:hypothetical protein